MRIPLTATLLLTLTPTLFAADPASPSAYTLTPARVTQLKSTTVVYQSLHILVTDTETQRKTVEELMTKLTAAHVRITGGPIFIFPQLPTSPTAETEIDIAIPVADKTIIPEGCESKTLDAVPTVTALYQGPTASMGQAMGGLFQQLRALRQIPTGELRTRSLYYEDPASPNNTVLLEIPIIQQ